MVHPSSNLEMVATVLALSNNGKFEPNNPGGGETSAAAVCKSCWSSSNTFSFFILMASIYLTDIGMITSRMP